MKGCILIFAKHFIFCIFDLFSGNVSILSWWFRDSPSAVIFDRTFQANMSLADDHKTWTVEIAGKNTSFSQVIICHLFA